MSNQITCPNCKTSNRADAKFCSKCRTPLQAGKTTQPLPPAQPASRVTVNLAAPPPPAGNGFADLPPGALVHDQFEIIQLFQPTPQMNLYLVADENANRQNWLLYESAQPDEFHPAEQIIRKELRHPALARVGHVFDEIQYNNAPRSYMTVEFPLGSVTEQTRLTEAELLKWGVELAQGLEALHQAGLAHNDIRRENLAQGNQVKLTHFARVAPLTPESRRQDIYQLAVTLQGLASPPGQTAAVLSPEVAQPFQRALVRNTANGYATAGAFAAALQEALENKRRPSSINLRVGRLTDVGVRRDLNEDAFATADLARVIQKGGQMLGLYVVSDGMGGASSGEIASQIVTDKMMQEFFQTIAPTTSDASKTTSDYGALLKAASEKANKAVYDERQRLRNDMGATLVAALVSGAQAFVVNVGDSRAYLLRDNKMERITQDHSLVQALVDSKQLKASDVRTHPQRNIITRSMGEKSSVAVDLFAPIALKVGDALFLCSDGMWEMAEDEVVMEKIKKNPDPQAAVQELVALANQNGGDDNITCVLVRVESASAAKK